MQRSRKMVTMYARARDVYVCECQLACMFAFLYSNRSVYRIASFIMCKIVSCVVFFIYFLHAWCSLLLRKHIHGMPDLFLVDLTFFCQFLPIRLWTACHIKTIFLHLLTRSEYRLILIIIYARWYRWAVTLLSIISSVITSLETYKRVKEMLYIDGKHVNHLRNIESWTVILNCVNRFEIQWRHQTGDNRYTCAYMYCI